MADLAIAIAGVLPLINEVMSFINYEHTDVHEDIKGIKKSLEDIEAFIKDNEDNTEGSARRKTQVQHLREDANEIQDVLDEFMLHLPRELHDRSRIYHKGYGVAHSIKHWIPLHGISSKIKILNERILSKSKDILRYDSERLSPNTHSYSHILDVPDEIIGFEKAIQELTDQLIKGPSRVDTIAVHGPGGSGKSILVNNVFESKMVKGHFDCYAWVYLSRSYNNNNNIQDIMYNMLYQFCKSDKKPIPYDHGADLLSNLKYYLDKKTYLLVLDNVWRKEDWESLKNTLPDNHYYDSRIIITTRNSDVASPCDRIHHLTSLQEPDALRLFCKKAFRNNVGICPYTELKNSSVEIVRKCEGSPLAIVALGDVLSKKPAHLSVWERFSNSLGSGVAEKSDLAIINERLLPSYKDLSNSLRNCFLYFSFFPAGYSIKFGRLIRLWVSEFVIQPSGRTPEEVAEKYLHELISRNVIHVSEMDYDGRVKTCRAVNLVQEFLIQKAEEDNFIVVDAAEKDGSGGVLHNKIRRLSIQNPKILQIKNRDLSCVRTMISITWGNLSSSEINDILVQGKFKLLRVLDLENTLLEEFPEFVFYLKLLRYLSLRNTRIKSVPRSIKKLPCLETLDLRETRVTEIPKEMWQLYKLRHLLVYGKSDVNSMYVEFNSLDEGANVHEGIKALTNLQKLSLVKSDKSSELVKELAALTQLKKLGMVSIKRKDGKDLCASIEKMKMLIALDLCSISKEECLDLHDMNSPPRYLQRLYLKGCLEKVPAWISSLDNLVKIGLKWSRLHYNPLKDLQNLPNLMELEMVDAYLGEELIFEAGKFKKLKKLRVEQVSPLHTIFIHKGAMPDLRNLSLSTCMNLKTLPWGINYLTHVEKFLLYNMSTEFIARLEKNSEDRQMVSHIPVIHSYDSNRKLHDLS